MRTRVRTTLWGWGVAWYEEAPKNKSSPTMAPGALESCIDKGWDRIHALGSVAQEGCSLGSCRSQGYILWPQ